MRLNFKGGREGKVQLKSRQKPKKPFLCKALFLSVLAMGLDYVQESSHR